MQEEEGKISMAEGVTMFTEVNTELEFDEKTRMQNDDKMGLSDCFGTKYFCSRTAATAKYTQLMSKHMQRRVKIRYTFFLKQLVTVTDKK